MKLRQFLCLLFLACTVGVLMAEDAPDSVTRSAIDDLRRYEQQASQLTSAQTSHARRILKLVNLSHERLQQSDHSASPAWQQTDAGYRQLQLRLDGLVNSVTADSTSTGNTSLVTSTQEEKAATSQFVETAPEASRVVPELVSGQRVQLKKLARDMTAVGESLVTEGPSVFQDADTVKAFQKRFQQFGEAMQRYPQRDDQDVVVAQAAYDKLQNELQTELGRAREQLASLGNVQARLSELHELLDGYPVPASLDIPFDEDAARAWVEQAGNSRSAAEHAYEQLLVIADSAYLPETRGLPSQGAAYDAGDVKTLIDRSQALSHNVQARYGEMIGALQSSIQQLTSELTGRWQENPDSDKRHLFLSEAQQGEAHALFDRAEAAALSFIALESVLQRDTRAGDDLLAAAMQSRVQFEEKVSVALNTSRMPGRVSNDPAMLEIASKILERSDYGFGEAGDIVLTTDGIVSRERKDSEVEFDDMDVSSNGDITLSGTETTWTYVWDEFKFAVPLKDTSTGHWHIWWLTARKFSSGGPRTPIGKWVSGAASQGNRILEANLQGS